VLPVPAVAYEYTPGCALASAMNSSIVVAFTDGFAISNCGKYPARATGRKSRCVSYEADFTMYGDTTISVVLPSSTV
jgi:hypothetical protein